MMDGIRLGGLRRSLLYPLILQKLRGCYGEE